MLSFDILPNTLSEKQIIELFYMMKKGDKSARNKIVEHNLRMVSFVIMKKFENLIKGNPQYTFDDLMSIGTFGLIKAVDTFKVEKGYNFSTYAIRVITNEILIDLRKTKKYKTEISLDETIKENEENKEFTVKDMVISEENTEEEYLKKEILQELKKSLEALTEKEKRLIELKYGLNNIKPLTQKAIGEKLEISQSFTSMIESKAIQKLALYFENKGIKEVRKFDNDIKKLSPMERAYFYANLVIEKNKTKEEIASNFGVTTNAIGKSITSNLKLLNPDLYEKYLKSLEKQKEVNLEKKLIKKQQKQKQEQENKEFYNHIQKYKVLNKTKEDDKMNKPLTEILRGYTAEQIKKALEQLDEKNRKMLLLKHPLEKEEYHKISEICKICDIKRGNFYWYINRSIEKLTMILEGKELSLKTHDINKVFDGYSEEQIMNAIAMLEDKYREIIELKFGLNGKKETSVSEISKNSNEPISILNNRFHYSKKLVLNILEGKTKMVSKPNEKKKNTNDIFEYFSDYTKEEVLNAINDLSEKNKNIIESRYGLNGKQVAQIKDMVSEFNIKYKTLSVRIVNIRGIISKALSKNSENKNIVEKKEIDKSEGKNSDLSIDEQVEKIKNSIKNGEFDKQNETYILHCENSKIVVAVNETIGLFAERDTKHNCLDRRNSITKKCITYIISIYDNEGKLVKQLIVIKNSKTNQFYRFLNTNKNGDYDVSSLKNNELICYHLNDIKGISKKEDSKEDTKFQKRIGKDNDIDTKNYSKECNYVADDALEVGIQLFKDHKLVKAKLEFIKALSSGKIYTLQKANYYLGRIYTAQKKPGIAIEYFNTGLRYNPDDYETLVGIGISYVLKNDYIKAMEYFVNCEKIKPNYIKHNLEIAKCYSQQGEYRKAIQKLNQIIIKNPNSYMVLLEKIKVLFAIKEYDEAYKAIKLCDKMKFAGSIHKIIQGKIEYLNGDKSYALHIFDEVVRDSISKDTITNIINIGYFFHERGEKNLAYKYYSSVDIFKNWQNIRDEEVEKHISLHNSNPNNERMHSVFNLPVSLNMLNNLIKKIDKTTTKELYDVYQIECKGIGYMLDEKENKVDENYITIFTLPFTKKIMLSYPDKKLPSANTKYSIDLKKLIEFSEYEVQSKNEVINTNDSLVEVKGEEKVIEIKQKNITETVEEKSNSKEIVETEKEEGLSEIKKQEKTGENKSISSSTNQEIIKEVVEENEVTFVKNKFETSQISLDFENHKNQIKMLINMLSDPTEQIVLLLRLGYVRDKHYTEEQIADFLKINKNEIQSIINNGLSNIMKISAITMTGVESARRQLEYIKIND